MTEFQKAKQKEWDEFGEANKTSKIELLKENSWFLIFGFLIIFIAIAGAPASGKSTISEKLKSELISKNHKSSVLQMDGFHLDNNILEKKN